MEPIAVRINADPEVLIMPYDGSNPDEGRKIGEVVNGMIEPLYFTWMGHDLVMWCNEDGRMLKLPINPFATMMLDSAMREPILMPIVGDVLITSARVVKEDVDGMNEQEWMALRVLLDSTIDIIEFSHGLGAV